MTRFIPSLEDVCLVGGFAAVVTGLWLVSPALALVVGGLVLFVAGGLATRRREPRR